MRPRSVSCSFNLSEEDALGTSIPCQRGQGGRLAQIEGPQDSEVIVTPIDLQGRRHRLAGTQEEEIQSNTSRRAEEFAAMHVSKSSSQSVL